MGGEVMEGQAGEGRDKREERGGSEGNDRCVEVRGSGEGVEKEGRGGEWGREEEGCEGKGDRLSGEVKESVGRSEEEEGEGKGKERSKKV